MAPLAIAIADQYAPLCQDAINRIRQVAHGLNDEGFIWVRSGSGHMNAPRRQLENEQRVVRDQSASGPDLGREKVCRDKGGPMCTKKRAPTARPLATGWDAFYLQDARDRCSSHAMAVPTRNTVRIASIEVAGVLR